MIDYSDELEAMDLNCDECPHAETFDGDWHSCIDQAKAAGWIIRPDGNGGFTHLCGAHFGR